MVHACISTNTLKHGGARAINREMRSFFFSALSSIYDINQIISLDKVNIHIYITNIRSQINGVNLLVTCNLFQIKAVYVRYKLNREHHLSYDEN